jgi:predicted nucleotidyltransferase component of viral defense system
MIDIDNPEGLMVWLMNYLADTFGNSAVLKGGMELRLLDCPRHTNDIDYVFVPFSSKKDIGEQILRALRQVPKLRVEHSINSKCLRCICEFQGIRAQIEVNVAEQCESQELTTATLARAHNQQGRIVRGMRFDVALAHKIAAWNERGLIRDLYDCAFMADILSVCPHRDTLERRLAKSEIRTGRITKRIPMGIPDLISKLKETLTSLTHQAVEQQLQDFFFPEQLPGIEKKMRIGLRKLLDSLEELEVQL